MPIVDKYSDMGTVVIGKVESGECEKGQTLAIYPNRTEVKVDQMWSDDIEVTKVGCGENVKVKLKGVDKRTGEKSKTRPRFIKQDQIAIVRFTAEDVICMETFKDHSQLGRFTLRDEGKE